ncbi:MAG TPA: type II secretion system F family protein [Gemmatimonadaceae bacterium]|jgi:general secretion pathway protein F
MQTRFAYSAAAMNGVVEAGTVDAESLDSARSMLATRGLYVVTLGIDASRHERRARISAVDLAIGLRILGDLLDAGLPAGRALHAFEELAPKGWRAALPSIRQAVREGQGLAAALRDAPVAIPPLVVGIVQAGEAGGGIAAAVRRAADLTEAGAETQTAVRAALAYPAVVGFAGVIAVTILMTVVLPRFAKILGDLGQALPASTRLVIALAADARVMVIPVLVAVAVGTLAWRSWTATTIGRRQWHGVLLGIPGLGSLRRSFAVARLAHSLSALLGSGVGMAAALGLAARAVADAELENRVLNARERVTAGQSLSHALETSDAATQTAIRLIRAGEESGRLGDMLSHAARIEQQRADRIVQAAVRMLEPALLLTFASVVALIAAALLQAIYSVRPAA